MKRKNTQVRAYFLWQEDAHDRRQLLSDCGYFLLAIDVSKNLASSCIFRDAKSDIYEECCVCMTFLAKVECFLCMNRICARCLLKIKSCPFCRAHAFEPRPAPVRRQVNYDEREIQRLLQGHQENLQRQRDFIRLFSARSE